MPHPDRLLERPRPHLGLRQRRAEARCGRHLLLAPEPAEQLVALGVAVPLVIGRDVEQLALRRPVALSDDEVESPSGQVVERGVVLVRAHRIEQAEGGDGGEQPDAGGQGGDMAQHDGRRGGDERPFVPFSDAEAIEAELLGQQRVVDHLPEAFGGGLQDPGHRVRGVDDEGDGQELHDATRSASASSG